VRLYRHLIIFLLLCILPACGDRQVVFRWAYPAPNMDGSLDDWPAASMTDAGGKNLEYGACNDHESVYIGIRIRKDSLAAEIMNRGVVIFLDTEGTGSRDLELHIPAWQPGEVDPSLGGFWQALNGDQKDSVQAHMERMRRGILCLDKKHQKTQVLAGGPEQYFETGIQDTKDGLALELKIPLRIQDAVPGAGPLGDKSRIGVGIRRNRLFGMRGSAPDPYRERRSFSPGGEDYRFGGMRDEGRPSGEGLQEVWFRVQLASPI